MAGPPALSYNSLILTGLMSLLIEPPSVKHELMPVTVTKVSGLYPLPSPRIRHADVVLLAGRRTIPQGQPRRPVSLMGYDCGATPESVKLRGQSLRTVAI